MGVINQEKVQLIVDYNFDDGGEYEKQLTQFCEIKYRLPLIGVLVVEICECNLDKIKGVDGARAIHDNAHITTQSNVLKKNVFSEYAKKNNLTGKGVTIAILDTGVAPVDDLVYPENRIIAFVDFINNRSNAYDDNAHGTHVAGIAAGNGYRSSGKYSGIATGSKIAAIKILDESGKGNAADVLAGIEWIIANKEKYNIRVANLSIGTTDIGSQDPLVKAVNKAWDMGIVMCIAAGNNGPKATSVTSPGVSKKAITIGASDDDTMISFLGNSLVNYSGRGPTTECIIKPDIVAPGSEIVSCLSNSKELSGKRIKKMNLVSDSYVQMSGTSMSAPVVAGAVALLLEKSPSLLPDDVKFMLKQSSCDLNCPQNYQGWGLLNIEKLLIQEVTHVR